jgi:hypothetical protein
MEFFAFFIISSWLAILTHEVNKTNKALAKINVKK